MDLRYPCDWNGCDRSAARHVEFSGRVFESRSIYISENGVHHCDLCEEHIAAAHLQYISVNELALGVCPLTCEQTT